jgi:hypothetical protein
VFNYHPPPPRGSSSDFDFTSLSTRLLRHHAGAAKAALAKVARAKVRRPRRGEAMGKLGIWEIYLQCRWDFMVDYRDFNGFHKSFDGLWELLTSKWVIIH